MHVRVFISEDETWRSVEGEKRKRIIALPFYEPPIRKLPLCRSTRSLFTTNELERKAITYDLQ